MPRLMLAATLLALVFLSFIAGSAVMRFEIFPYPLLREAYLAAEARLIQQKRELPIEMLHVGAKPIETEDYPDPPVRDDRTGVFRYDAERAYNGYTLYTTGRSSFPVPLIDMQGNTIHEWSTPVDQLWGDRVDDVSISERAVGVTYQHLFPNGDLLMVLTTVWQTPWGFGIIKVDKDSNLLWSYLYQAHHNLDIGPDGEIYAQIHSVRYDPWPGLERIETPFVQDGIVVLSPDGEPLKTVNVLQAIQDSKYASLLMFASPNNPRGDLLHTNSVQYIGPERAARMPFAEEGQLLISLRNLDIIAVLDLESELVTWAQRGSWRMQHDPHLLADGNIMLFDNRGDLSRGGKSRVLEFNPISMQTVWEFPGDSPEFIYTSVYGSQERLPNGNTLISETNNGRFLEVTPTKDVVWEYFVPERKINARNETHATAGWGHRFAAEDLNFDFNGGLPEDTERN